MQTDYDIIKEATGLNDFDCSCNKCKAMCKTAPCMGTPSEMIKLIEAGFVDKLQLTIDFACMRYGLGPVEMIMPLFNEEKQRCTFLNENDLCMLHDLKLKPSEGRLANCNLDTALPGKEILPAFIHKIWESKSVKVAESFFKFFNYQTKISIK